MYHKLSSVIFTMTHSQNVNQHAFRNSVHFKLQSNKPKKETCQQSDKERLLDTCTSMHSNATEGIKCIHALLSRSEDGLGNWWEASCGYLIGMTHYCRCCKLLFVNTETPRPLAPVSVRVWVIVSLALVLLFLLVFLLFFLPLLLFLLLLLTIVIRGGRGRWGGVRVGGGVLKQLFQLLDPTVRRKDTSKFISMHKIVICDKKTIKL